MKIIFIFLLSCGVAFGQGAATEICTSTVKQIVTSKSLVYNSKEKYYSKAGQYGLIDFLEPSQDKAKIYLKSYYYVNDEKMSKALLAFLDDSFVKVEGHTNVDYLDEEKYRSSVNNITVTYRPMDNYQLDIIVFCLNNR